MIGTDLRPALDGAIRLLFDVRAGLTGDAVTDARTAERQETTRDAIAFLHALKADAAERQAKVEPGSEDARAFEETIATLDMAADLMARHGIPHREKEGSAS